MKSLTRLALAASAVLLGVSLGAVTAVGAPSEPTIDNPGGIEAVTSPAGVPANGYGPDLHLFLSAKARSGMQPGLNPLGANDFNCVPQAGQNPVVLVPGTAEDAYAAWAYFSPRLKQAGYCVFTFNYNPSTHKDIHGNVVTDDDKAFSGDIKQTAAFMAGFVDRVLAATGAQKVDLVGHSQGGGVLPRSYIKWYGGDKKVDKLIGLVPNNHGTTMGGMNELFNKLLVKWPGIKTDVLDATNQQGLLEQLVNSELLTSLNEGGMTYPDIKYTVISTKLDTVVTPYTNAFIEEPGVKNLTLQDVCPADAHLHQNIPYSDVALQLTLRALNADNLSWQMPVECYRYQAYLKASDLI